MGWAFRVGCNMHWCGPECSTVGWRNAMFFFFSWKESKPPVRFFPSSPDLCTSPPACSPWCSSLLCPPAASAGNSPCSCRLSWGWSGCSPHCHLHRTCVSAERGTGRKEVRGHARWGFWLSTANGCIKVQIWKTPSSWLQRTLTACGTGYGGNNEQPSKNMNVSFHIIISPHSWRWIALMRNTALHSLGRYIRIF